MPKPKIAAPLIHAIEDAILLGNIQEIDFILELVREDETFPQDLRHALESLMFFRSHYGKGGMCEPQAEADRQKAAAMESSWGREVIEMIGHYPDLTQARYA